MVKSQLLMAIGVALSVVQAGPIDNSNGGNKPTLNNKAICTTSQCVLTASGILNDMDPTADPCQDFNQFACGGMEEKYDIPFDASSIGPSELLQKNNECIIRSIVDVSLGKVPKAAPGDAAAQNNIKKLLDFYASCMDETSTLKVGRKPLVDEVQKIIQSFPASASSANKANLSKALGRILKSRFRLSSLFQLVAEPAMDDPSVKVLAIYEQGLKLDQEDYKSSEIVQMYTDTVAAMFQIVFGEEDVVKRTQPLTNKDVGKKWMDVAKDVVDFETQLAAIRTPQLDLWDLNKANNPRTTLPAGLNYTRLIVASSLPYLTKPDGLLQKTSSKTLQYYFSWFRIQSFGPYLAKPYREPLGAFDNTLSGISGDAKVERWKVCVPAVNINLGQMVGHYYIQEVFKADSRQEVIKIMENVLLSYEKTFPTLSWLDKITRDGAIKKLKVIVQSIGYSTESPDVASSANLDAYYKDYAIDAVDYVGNQIRFSA
ncbi:hypothetical protein BG015_000215 [Linnemannia schmuckeri]|uniref:Peptidase M13 N-terminal domain-containing protein n=1 Tax=Linnemannia schmuckeri TaxID=64567 RepID=A0A9P5S4J1_9FUNG|nr:hypothetical protein BG015_000215 [Linnemannia schmuckeri]